MTRARLAWLLAGMFFIPGCAPLPRPATAPAPQLYLDPRLPDHARVCVRLQIGFHCPMTVGELRTLLRRYQRVAVEASR